MSAFKFTLSDSVKGKMTEEEIKFQEDVYSQLTEKLNSELQKSLSNPNEDLITNLKSIVEDVCKDNGMNDKIEKLQSVIDKQEKTIKSIQENGGNANHRIKQSVVQKMQHSFLEKLPQIKSLYDKYNGEQGVKPESIEIVPRQKDIETKAIDEHNPSLIITTENVVTSTETGNWLAEMFGVSNVLNRVRRPIEYIRSLASITNVARVPEYFEWYDEGDETGAFAIVEENEVKPQIGLSLIKYFTKAQKAAGYIVVTEEVIKWRSMAWTFIQRLFRDKLERDYNRLLNTELIVNAIAYPGTPLDGTITNPTDIDAVAAAALAVELTNHTPDTIVINPADKWRIWLSTNSNGTYTFLPFVMNGDEPQLFGFRVITSTYVPVGTFYIGESGTWYVIEETPSIRTGWVNDDFIHNRMTIIGEIWFLSYVPAVNDGAWIAGDFDTIKDALQV